MENAGVTLAGPLLGEKHNPGSTDTLGTKQFSGRSGTEDLTTMASATTTTHRTPHGKGRNAGRPSVRDPKLVNRRIARGNFSAESLKPHRNIMNENADIIREQMTEEVQAVEDEINEILESVQDLWK
jgi:hypothetical protein